MNNFYKISGKIDSTKFFKSLGNYFKDATTLFIEGNFIEKDVLILYRNHLQEGEYLPRLGTIFPKSTKLRCKYSLEFMNKLASISERHAEPELCDHLHLYKNNEPLLEWMDAFSDPILVSKEVPKEVIENFSAAIKI